MKVENMTSSRGNKVANQFIVNCDDTKYYAEYLQSYNSVIAKKMTCRDGGKTYIILDRDKWDYSRTTSKYRNIFLGESKKETEKKIKSGEYVLADLN